MFSNKVLLCLKQIDELFEVIELHRVVDMFKINSFYYLLINVFEDES